MGGCCFESFGHAYVNFLHHHKYSMDRNFNLFFLIYEIHDFEILERTAYHKLLSNSIPILFFDACIIHS